MRLIELPGYVVLNIARERKYRRFSIAEEMAKKASHFGTREET